MILEGIEDFLEAKSDKNQKYNRLQLNRLRNFLVEEQKLKSFSDVEKIHIRRFLTRFVNEQEWRKKTKNKVKEIVNAYVEYLKEYDLIEKDLKIKEKIKFQDHISPLVQKKLVTPNPRKNDIIQIIKHAKKTNEKMYILYSLLATNGMRRSELLSIRLENINLDERFFLTGVVQDAQKTGYVYYFIHKKLLPDFRNYYQKITHYYRMLEIEMDELEGLDDIVSIARYNEIKNKFKKGKFLFPGDTKTGYYTGQNLSTNLENYIECLYAEGKVNNCKKNTHACRHALNHYRVGIPLPNEVKDIPNFGDDIRKILENHYVGDTNREFYLEEIVRDPIKRRYYWDLLTPDLF